MNPVDNPTAYDTITLGGQKSPGQVTIGSLAPKRSEGWDSQKAAGADGAELVHKGAPPAKFSVELYLWKDEAIDHFAGWDNWRDILKTPTDETSQKALDIYHPVLAEAGITSVVVAAWTPPIPDGQGGATVTIEFIEYRPSAERSTGKPGGSTNSKQGGGAPGKQAEERKDPNKDLKDKLAQRRNEYKELDGA